MPISWLAATLRLAAAAATLAAPTLAAAALETVAADDGARMQRLSGNAYVIGMICLAHSPTTTVA